MIVPIWRYGIETLIFDIPGLSILGTLGAPLIADFLTNNVGIPPPAHRANVDGVSPCPKAFPGVPELQPLPIRMSSHPRLVRRLRMVTMPVF